MKNRAAAYPDKSHRTVFALAALALLLGAGVALGQFRPGQPPPFDAMFRQMDTNRDGKLTKQEFAALARIAPRLKDNPEQAETIFGQIDGNNDGFVSLEEFRGFGRLMAQMQGAGGSPEAQMRFRLDAGFKAMDANGDQKLDPKEFEKLGQYVKRLEGDSVSIQYLFTDLDKNQDGSLTLEEYRGLQQLADAARPPQPAAAKSTAPERPPTQEELAFFEKKIRPVLADKCYKCHSASAEKVKGSLVLDTREGIRRGGDNGPAVIPGDVDQSLLIKAIHYTESDMEMPPKKEGGKLPDSVIADFEQWVRMGAPDPREGKSSLAKKVDIEKGKQHWAFQLPKKAPAPAVKDASWAKTDIDRLVLAELEKRNLTPVGDADKRTLIRRVYFDLIGLPPTPEEVEAFLNDASPDAFATVVDSLLVKPQFGERWGRHWLDVARYAESSGKENNIVYPHAWRYRDYVIKSFDFDKPYDQFLMEQIAGDLLPAKDDTDKAWKQIATGYLAIGPKSHNTREVRQFQLDVADEQIDALGQGMLGLTIACARCHDHKFDPIPQADYYAMAGIFLSTETCFGTPRFVQNNQITPLVQLPSKASIPTGPSMPPQLVSRTQAQLKEGQAIREEMLSQAKGKRDRTFFADPKFIRSIGQIGISEKLLERFDDNGNPSQFLAMGVKERMFGRDTQLLARGELDKPLEVVPRGFVQVVGTKEAPKISKGSGRLELAKWIASPENPLTARVMSNRIWLNLFDKGIVTTPDNFGSMGQLPSNQPLLDHLAISFVENGWSVKKLIREIVLSRTYQLASDYNAANYATDPDNTYHWRMSKRRLDAESIRDSMLFIAGALDMHAVSGSSVALSEGPVQVLMRFNMLQSEQPVRSVYLPIVRDQVPESLAVFDFAEPSLVTGDRDVTTVPSQALYLMNDTFVQRVAEAMADKLLGTGRRGMDLANDAFQLAFGRPPTDKELAATKKFFESFNAAESGQYQSKDRLGRAGMAAFCQGLLGSAEFRYLN